MPLCSVLMMHLVSHTHAGCDASVVVALCSVEVLIKLLGLQRSKDLLDERGLSLKLCLLTTLLANLQYLLSGTLRGSEVESTCSPRNSIV